jgi:hypothetical protein
MHRRNSSSEFCSRLAVSRRIAMCRPRMATQRRDYIHDRQNVVLSCALNPKRKTAVGNAAYVHKRGIGILK